MARQTNNPRWVRRNKHGSLFDKVDVLEVEMSCGSGVAKPDQAFFVRAIPFWPAEPRAFASTEQMVAW
jgi:hypothetical protein